jgi:hypothetical protein
MFYVCARVCVYVFVCHLGWCTLVLKCSKNNYDSVYMCVRAYYVCVYYIHIHRHENTHTHAHSHTHTHTHRHTHTHTPICTHSMVTHLAILQQIRKIRTLIHILTEHTHTYTHIHTHTQHTHIHTHTNTTHAQCDEPISPPTNKLEKSERSSANKLLWAACQNRDLAGIQLALAAGASINARNKRHCYWGAVHYAAAGPHIFVQTEGAGVYTCMYLYK